MTTPLSAHRTVVKRDGKTTPFNIERIVRSIALALFAARQGDIENPLRHDAERRYGLGEDDFARARSVARSV